MGNEEKQSHIGWISHRVRRTAVVASATAIITMNFAARAGSVSITVESGQGVFTQNGTLFTPRAVNFEREDSSGYHNIFDPGAYNARDVSGEMNYIAYSGYNVVRVNLSSTYANTGFSMTTQGIGATWLSNLQNFLETAASDGIQVILATDSLPSNYDTYLGQNTNTQYSEIANFNTPILSPGFANGLAQYFADIINGLNHSSPTASTAIMALEVQNEGYILPACAPFTANTCTVDAQNTIHASPGPAISTIEVNGVTYNMSVDADRQSLVDASTFNLISTVRSKVRAINSTILVSMGAFTIWEGIAPSAYFNGVHAQTSSLGERYPVRPYMIGTYSSADFVDVHVYPGDPTPASWSLQAELSSDEITTSTYFSKPMLMGEFGVSDISGRYPALADAANVLSTLQTNSCSYGFVGWSLWTWDTGTTPTQSDWNAKQDNGAINGVVSPQARPSICSAVR